MNSVDFLRRFGKSILEQHLFTVNINQGERRQKVVYQNVKALADKKGMTIAEVERRSGLTNGTIGKWRHASPTIKSLEAVASVLGVSIARLTRRTE